MQFRIETIENFQRITGFDLEDLFSNVILFTTKMRNNILEFYSGEAKTPNIESFKFMNKIIEDTKVALVFMMQQKDYFNSIEHWILLEMLEDIRTKLLTTSNIGFYIHSSIQKNQFNTDIEREVKLKQYDTLEKVTKREYNTNNFDNEWVGLSIYNDLEETDYTTNGGIILKAIFPNRGNQFNLDSVLGPLQGELLYGIDLDKKIQYVDNDKKILTPNKTILQAVKILIGLKQGDNPQFPGNGLSSALFVGTNVGSLSFPSIFRQMVNTFKNDDTIFSLVIENVRKEEDALFIDYNIQTKYGESYIQTQQINQ